MHHHFLLAFFLIFSARGFGQESGIDFLTGKIRVYPHPTTQSLEGEVLYTLRSENHADSLALDARNMEIGSLLLDGQPVPYRYDGSVLRVEPPGHSGPHTLEIAYRTRPEQTVYYVGWEDRVEGNEEIWTQGQGKYSSHWVPSFDDMREKVVFDLEVTAPPQFSVVANGKLEAVRMRDPGSGERAQTWSHNMDQPMSSYLLAFAVGRYDSLLLNSASGVPLYLYFPEGDSAKAAVTYRHTRELFEFLETEIGVPYPWSDYKQVPVRDFLYAGMENTGATFFARSFLVDSIGVADRDYLNVNAHEMAHQWFGNLVTETDGAQHWLHEGFATFYAYLAEEHLRGKEQRYWSLYRTATALNQQQESDGGAALTDPGAGSLTFYEKGAWALFILRDYLGREAFRKGIREYLSAYAYGNATVAGFLDVMESVGATPLDAFRRDWLDTRSFPHGAALDYLSSRSPSLAYYLELTQQEPDSASLRMAWEAFGLAPYRTALLLRYGSSLGEDLLREAFGDTRTEVQKALLETLGDTQDWMKPYFDRMLDAASYELREAALYRLWTAYPEDRAEVLDRTAANGSMAAPEFRQSWWLLALFTENYAEPSRAANYLSALRATTRPSEEREVRENGFRLLYQVDALAEENVIDLLGATEHPSWQFRLFARRLLDDLMETRPEREFWERLTRDFSPERYPYVHSKLENL